MTAHDLLLQLRAKGVQVKTSGDDRLVIDAPKGTVTDELRSALSLHKAEILQILKSEQAGTAEPAISAAPASAPIPPMFTAPAARPAAPAPEVMSPVAAEPVSAKAPVMPSFKQDEEPAVAASAAEEISRLEAEMMRLRAEEEGRRAEVETARLSAENALRLEQERWRQQEEETARQRAQKEKQRIEVEAREQAEEEHHRQIAEHELRRAEEELKRMRAMEETRRAEVDHQRLAAQAAHEAELGVLRQAEEENAGHRTEQERHYLETEARKKSQEDELRRRAEMRFRAVEEEIARVQARDDARVRAVAESQRLAEDVARRRAEEEARRQAETEALRRAEDEARLRAEIEAQMRADAEQRRRAEDEARRVAEEEARRRAEEEAQRLAAEQARRLAEAEAQRRADEAARRQAEEAARLVAEEGVRRQAEALARRQAEEETSLRAEAAVRQRAELEARIRAEIEEKMRAEEAERHEAEGARRRAEHERILAEEAAKAPAGSEFSLEIERAVEASSAGHDETSNVREISEWVDAGVEDREQVRAIEPAPHTYPDDHFGSIHDDAGDEFAAVSVPDSNFMSAEPGSRFHSENPSERAAAVSELPHLGGEEAFQQVSAAFDDQSVDVRNAAARAMSELQEDRAAAFTRALRDANPERRRKIGSAIASSGLANEAIRNLTGESRDKTYDAFSLLFLMSKAGELQPLMRAIEEHSNIEVRLAVIKLLALSGQPDILPAFRRMAVRGSLPPDVRSAIMEAIYQITSQSPAEAPSMS
jgi:tubulysin polyketide synthase-like protein/HEAT repeat protein